MEDQRSDPGSMLHLARDLIALRRRTPDLQTGDYATLQAPPGVWAWRRGTHVLVALNMSDIDATLPGIHGVVRIGTDRRRDGEHVAGEVRLESWEGIVIETPAHASATSQ